MVDGVLVLVLNPSNPVSIGVDSCEQVYIRIILRQILCSCILFYNSLKFDPILFFLYVELSTMDS